MTCHSKVGSLFEKVKYKVQLHNISSHNSQRGCRKVLKSECIFTRTFTAHALYVGGTLYDHFTGVFGKSCIDQVYFGLVELVTQDNPL